MRGLLCIAFVVAVIPTPAEACTCGSFEELTPASCRGAARVFAGTVARYRWPTAYDHATTAFLRWRPVEVELAIDRVWSGDVRSSLVALTGYGGGDCGIHPLPGTRFVVCDDETADAPPDFTLCSRPAFDDPTLEAALGTAHPPVRSLWRARPSWWRDPLLAPLSVVAVFAVLGRCCRRARSGPRVRYRMLLLAMVACAAATIAMRFAELPVLAAYGPVVLAIVIGGAVGFHGQRRPQCFAGWFGGLVVAIAFAALPVSLGYAPLHLPWNQESAIACSRQRAEEILARDEPLEGALAREPYACTDWGMARYRALHEHCLGFADGDGGEWYVCRSGGATSTFIGPELPR